MIGSINTLQGHGPTQSRTARSQDEPSSQTALLPSRSSIEPTRLPLTHPVLTHRMCLQCQKRKTRLEEMRRIRPYHLYFLDCTSQATGLDTHTTRATMATVDIFIDTDTHGRTFQAVCARKRPVLRVQKGFQQPMRLKHSARSTHTPTV